MNEEWKPVPDYPAYHVSNFGRVKSFHKGKQRIRKPKLTRYGYLQVGLWKDGKPKHFAIHRLVAKAFIPNPENKPEINHRDGNKLNNFVGNLEWCTSSENKQHAFTTGLKVAPKGEDHPNAKLTVEQVLFIRENPDSLTVYELADLLDVCIQTISDIQLGRKYKTVGGIIRQKRGVPDDIKAVIRAEYVRGSREFGTTALAKKYSFSQHTVWKIVNSSKS